VRSFTSQLFRILLVFLLVFVNTATFPSDSDSYHSIPNGSESETEDTEDTEDIEESNLISLSDPESLIVVGKPDEQKLHDILEHAYNSQQDFISRMKNL
jgi:hypothetical protein